MQESMQKEETVGIKSKWGGGVKSLRIYPLGNGRGVSRTKREVQTGY